MSRDSVGAMLSEPATRNFNTWNVLNNWVWPNNYIGGTFSAELVYLKNWIEDRFIWMDNNLPGFAFDCSFLSRDEKLKPSVLVFPNPFSDNFYIDILHSENINQNVKVDVYDLSGIIISSYKSTGLVSKSISSLDILKGKKLTRGIYVLSIQLGVEISNFKLVKQ